MPQAFFVALQRHFTWKPRNVKITVLLSSLLISVFFFFFSFPFMKGVGLYQAGSGLCGMTCSKMSAWFLLNYQSWRDTKG